MKNFEYTRLGDMRFIPFESGNTAELIYFAYFFALQVVFIVRFKLVETVE